MPVGYVRGDSGSLSMPCGPAGGMPTKGDLCLPSEEGRLWVAERLRYDADAPEKWPSG
jgi:hypothetical protein